MLRFHLWALAVLLALAPVGASAQSVRHARQSADAIVDVSCTADHYIGLTGTGVQTVNVAADCTPQIGQTFVIDDVGRNANKSNKTLVAPAGHTFEGMAQFVMRESGESVRVTYYGSSLWGIAP